MKSVSRNTICDNLKSKVSIIRNGRVSDGYGGYSDEWVTIKECRASIKPLRAKEVQEAQRVQQETTHNIIIRYFDDIQNSDRIKHKEKEYEITSIIDIDNEGVFLELLCVERGN